MSATQPLPLRDVEKRPVWLRALEASDESLYREIYCDTETMRFVGEPLSSDQATRSFRAALRHAAKPDAGALFLVVIDKTTGAQLGICGATLGMPRLGSAEVGIMLTRLARGKGRSHDALESFIDHVFESFDVNQVWVKYAVEQVAVVRLNEGLGFIVSEQNLQGSTFNQTAYIDRSEWPGCVKSINRE